MTKANGSTARKDFTCSLSTMLMDTTSVRIVGVSPRKTLNKEVAVVAERIKSRNKSIPPNFIFVEYNCPPRNLP